MYLRLQFVSCSTLVYTGKLLKIIEMDDFEWAKAKFFLVYVVSFSIGTWANIKVQFALHAVTSQPSTS